MIHQFAWRMPVRGAGGKPHLLCIGGQQLIPFPKAREHVISDMTKSIYISPYYGRRLLSLFSMPIADTNPCEWVSLETAFFNVTLGDALDSTWISWSKFPGC